MFDFFSAGLGTEIFCAVSWEVSGNNECITFILICCSWTEAFIFMSHQGVVIFQCRNNVKYSWYCILCERIHIFLNIPLFLSMRA